jgi:hypothetical protein
MTITLKQAQEYCRALGFILTKNDEEYRVNTTHGCEDTAYCTSDIEDAINTAAMMTPNPTTRA